MFKLTEPHTKHAHFNGQRLRWREGTSSSSSFLEGYLLRVGAGQFEEKGRAAKAANWEKCVCTENSEKITEKKMRVTKATQTCAYVCVL